nr:MAG TPA: hypothetical protein [Caudoviricetes sp.]
MLVATKRLKSVVLFYIICLDYITLNFIMQIERSVILCQ